MFLNITTPQKIKLEYNIFGNGQPLVFIHGGGTNYHYYEPFFEKLGEKFKIYAFSYPGFGLSSNMKSYTIENFVQAIDAFVEAMNLKEFVLMGQSLGGGIATYYASHQSKFKIKELVLLCPATTPLKKNILKLYKDLKKQHPIEVKYDEHYFDLIDRYYQNGSLKFKSKNLKYPVNILKLYRFISKTNFIEDYQNLTMPVKVFWGDQDLILGAETFEKAWGHLNKANVSVQVFPGFGHNFFFPKYKEIIDAI